MSVVDSLTKIAGLSKSIVESKKNFNALTELIQFLQLDQDVLVKAAVSALDKAYSHIATQKDVSWMLRPPKTKTKCSHGDDDHEDDDSSAAIVHQYHLWMRATYISCRDQLLCLLHHPQQTVAGLALELLLKMVGWEGHTSSSFSSSSSSSSSSSPSRGCYGFPNDLFHAVVTRLLENSVGGEALIGQCTTKWLAYHDVLFHWLKNIASIITSKLDTKQSASVVIPEHFVENVYFALRAVVMPTQESELDRFLAGSPAAKAVKASSATTGTTLAKNLTSLHKYRKHFSDAWLSFLRLLLPPRTLRLVLVELHSCVVPHLLDPRLLLDFLTSAYDHGGVVSLLALNGLFILMSQYHLDYPSFYPKLYQLLDPSIFHVKYMPRFIRLLDTFLSSTHLPLYLVAAFIKKLSRLSLTAPPEGVVLVVVMVTNLTKRHPNCRVLIHRTNTDDFSPTSDPFDCNEPDPAESRALESCLWELKTLECHYSPLVVKVVRDLIAPDGLGSKAEAKLERYLRSLDQYKAVDFDSSVEMEVALNCTQPTSLWQQY